MKKNLVQAQIRVKLQADIEKKGGSLSSWYFCLSEDPTRSATSKKDNEKLSP